MSKLKYDDALNLVNTGIITQAAFEKMQTDGLITQNPKPKDIYYLTDGNGVKVQPILLFRALDKVNKGFKVKDTEQIARMKKEIEVYLTKTATIYVKEEKEEVDENIG